MNNSGEIKGGVFSEMGSVSYCMPKILITEPMFQKGTKFPLTEIRVLTPIGLLPIPVSVYKQPHWAYIVHVWLAFRNVLYFLVFKLISP